MELHKSYTGNTENNIFPQIPYELKNAPLAYEEYESYLSKLSDKNFDCFKSKILKYGKKDELRGFSQFTDILNELKGYAYLENLDYDRIEFVKERQGAKTPDLKAINGNKLSCLLEVKTINPSDDDRKLWNKIARNQNSTVRRVQQGILDGFKKKINSTISEARQQLFEYDSSDDIEKIGMISHFF